MTKRVEISASQLVTLLFLSRAFTLLTYSTKTDQISQNAGIIFALALSAMLYVAALIPTFLLVRRRRDYSIIEWSFAVKPWFGKGVAALYFAFLVLVTANTISHFEFFLTSSIYPNASPTLFVVLFLLAVAYAAYMGLEACARMSGFVFWGVAAGTAFLFLCLFQKADPIFLRSPFSIDLKTTVATGFSGVWASLEITTILLLIPMVRGNLTKASGALSAMIMVYYQLISVFAITSLGEYAQSHLFPIYSMAAVAEFSVMQRLDSLFMAMWVFIAFVRTALFFYLAVHMLGYLAPKPVASRGIGIVGALVLLISLVLANNYQAMRLIRSFFASGIAVVLFLLVVPGIVLCTAARKKEVSQ